jgi:hypothetical protein
MEAEVSHDEVTSGSDIAITAGSLSVGGDLNQTVMMGSTQSAAG